MRAASLLACSAVALVAAAAACAASEENRDPSPDSGSTETPASDSGPADADAGPDAEADRSCSKAGWCQTALPDSDLVVLDIWPLAARAFAIAESQTLGVKVLEWSEASARWRYIDDDTQNEAGLGDYAGRIWAFSDDEVYFGVSPGYIYRGTRPSEGAPWTWTRERLRDSQNLGTSHPASVNGGYQTISRNNPALGVWGTGSGDVYAWFANTIYHRESVDGGAPQWVQKYVADDADVEDERLFFLAAAGTGQDDVWFSGARLRPSGGCALVVHKQGAAYKRSADGIVSDAVGACTARAGVLELGGAEGWLTDIHAVAPGEIVGLKGANDPVRISATSGGYTATAAPIPKSAGLPQYTPVESLWATPGALWVSTFGLVLRADDAWDAGEYRVSTVAMNGAPILHPLFRVRGTSNTNLWVVGEFNALHKTTP